MTDSPPRNGNQKCNSESFRILQTERIDVDVSNFPIGPLEDQIGQDLLGSVKSTKTPSDDDDSFSSQPPPHLLLQHSAGSNSWEQEDGQDEITRSTYATVVCATNNSDEDGLLVLNTNDLMILDNSDHLRNAHDAADPPEPTQPPASPRRKTSFRYAKQRFVATREFYLQEPHLFTDADTSTMPPPLVGHIEKCPNEKTNDNNYIVRWSHVHLTKAQIPPNLIPHLRTRYPKQGFKDSFRELIEAFAIAQQSNAISITTNGLQPHDPVVVTAAANIILAAVATPPSMLNQTKAALSAIYTAGSSGGWSAMSSLGRSQRSLFNLEDRDESLPGRQGETDEGKEQDDEEDNDEQENDVDSTISVGVYEDEQSQPATSHTTRSRKRTREPDSDDDVTEDEDNHEPDIEQNFWHHREKLWRQMQKQEEAYESRSEDEDEDDVVAPSTESPFDVATLLNRATDFGFQEMNTEETAAMPEPPQIYHAPFGIKEGIAEQVKTPFDAFRLSGFTERMVAKWTKNSNK